MKKQEVKVVPRYEWAFERQEADLLLIVLDYAYHRLHKHGKSGLHGWVKKDAVDTLRKQLRNSLG